MTQSTEPQLVTRVRTLAQHELAHFVAAIAVGFQGYDVTFRVHPTEPVHRGKSRVDSVVRCDTLDSMREFMNKRAIVLLAGVMGETVSRDTFKVDMEEAYKRLEHGETGAALDYAVIKELAQLLDNSSSEEGDGLLPARGAGSMKVFQELFVHAATVVEHNARPICALADVLASRVKPSEGGLIEATLSLKEMEQIGAFLQIQRFSLSDSVI